MWQVIDMRLRHLLLRKITWRHVIICIIATTLIIHPTVHAVGFKEPPEISNKQKAHFNISFTGGGGSSSTQCDPNATVLNGKDNTEKAWRFFSSKGFPDNQIAGIIGNFLAESGMNPKRVQGVGTIESETLPSSGGYGLAQWDDRKPLLQKFSQEVDPQKRPVYDLSLQLDFVMFELSGDAAKGGSTEASPYAAFKPTTTIRDATYIWMDRYERPGDRNIEDRVKLANKTYGEYATGAGNVPGEPITPEATAGCGGSGNIVAIAQAELAKGVREDPIGCDQDNLSRPGNCGSEVNKYTDNTLQYWCADFVSWVYKTAGTPFSGGESGGWRIPGVDVVSAYIRENGTYTMNGPGSPAPQPGDIYTLDLDPFKAGDEHIGIVVKVVGGDMYTISGNTSVDNTGDGIGVGDAVYRNYQSNSTITGYGGLR